MRLLVIGILTFLIAGLSMAASNQRGHLRAKAVHTQYHAEYGTPEVLSGSFSYPGVDEREAKAYTFFASNENSYKLINPDLELEFISGSTDDIGLTHLDFQQVYNDLEVWGCRTIVHFDANDAIYIVGGQTIPTPDISTVAVTGEAEARSSATAALKEESLPVNLDLSTKLIIYPDGADPKLVHLVTVTSPDNGGIRWLVFVDAQNGTILHKFNDIHFDGPDTGSGPDVLNINRSFPIYLFGSDYKLFDEGRDITSYNDFYNSGPISTDPNGDKIWDDNTGQKAEVAGHYFAGLTYDYFLSTFGRDSYDGAGASILVNLHDPLYVNNAYWNGQGINFADGDGVNFAPFSGSLDVVAHELTHGVTQHNGHGGLIYQFQSGALNESFSDVFGAMVDRDDWLLGEDIALWLNGFIRSMENPSLKGHPMHMSEYINYDISADNGGVHRNSGIPNHAFYQCVTLWGDITAGKLIAEQIWYRTLTTYMTPSAGFYYWAGMITQSAIDLYGPASSEVANARAALAAVGLGTAYALPQVVSTGAAFGTSSSQSIWIYSPSSGSGSQAVSAVAPSISGLSIANGPGFQSPIPDGDSSEFILTLDAAGLTECDIGTTLDTLRFDIAGLINSQIKLPLAATVGYTTFAEETESFSTFCLSVQGSNSTELTYFERDGVNSMYDGSLMIGLIDGTDTSVFRDFHGTETMATVDLIDNSTPGERSFRIATADGRIQGNVTYRFDPTEAESCEFIIIDYLLTNPCDSAVTILVGMFADFDIANSGANLADFDDSEDLIYVSDGGAVYTAGLALLSGTTRNLRVINNPDLVWGGDFTDGVAYAQMASSFNATGGAPTDYSALITFGEETIGANDTARFTVAMVYSNSGLTDLLDILQTARDWNDPPGCCIGIRGNANGDMSEDVNISDVSYLVDYLFGVPLGDVPPCPDEGNANGDVDNFVNISDITYLVDYLFGIPLGGPPPVCP